MQERFIHGFQYYITFVDHFSPYCWVYLTARKNDANVIFEKWERWRADAETKPEERTSCLQTDVGGEHTHMNQMASPNVRIVH